MVILHIVKMPLITVKSRTVRLITMVALCLSCFVTHADTVKPFSTDGCSLFPNGTSSVPKAWLSCCIEHDKAYWRGGTYDQRKTADYELKSCVEAVGEPDIAAVMLYGVRLGGSPYLPTPFRWGYGWSYLRGYKALSPSEIEQVNALKNNSRNSSTQFKH